MFKITYICNSILISDINKLNSTIMKKILVLLCACLFSSLVINAKPITITLSNGRVFVVDSDNFKDSQDLMDYVEWLEKTYGSTPFVPGIGQGE